MFGGMNCTVLSMLQMVGEEKNQKEGSHSRTNDPHEQRHREKGTELLSGGSGTWSSERDVGSRG